MKKLSLLAVLFPTAAQVVYDLPPLRGDEQDKEFRTQAEVNDAARRVLEQYADKTLASWGILDVTKAPYNARGDGTADDTEALQRALKDARDARLVTWLPPGTYLVRDTLQCVQGGIDPRSGATGEDRLRADDFPCVLQGPGGPRRAVLRLAENAEGFGDPARPRPLILIWARRWAPPYDLQPNVSFNQMLISIDVDIRGHAGAIGVDMQGAQGTAVQDVRVEAEGAFAGMRGLPGSGGSTHQIMVRGGRYGVYAAGIGAFRSLSGAQPSPLLAAATLTGQTVASIYYAGRGPLTVVGARIEGKGIVCDGQSRAYNGGLNLVDSSVETDAAAIQSNRPVYISNTYVRGPQHIVRFSGDRTFSAQEGGWTWVREYAGAPEGPFPVWLDGAKQSSPWALVEAAAAGPPEDLQSRHMLPDWAPDWDSPGLINVRQAPYNAAGDGTTDDADAIQRALDEHPAVFLPKGRYKLGRPLLLPPGRKLVGAGRAFTVLLPVHNAAPFRDAAAPSPLIDTVDDEEAETAVARLELRAVIPGAYALRWRAGCKSVVRDVNFRRWPSAGSLGGPYVLIEGNGGGRWFNFVQHETMPGDGYRHLLVRSTRQPLTFYMFNPEHARSEVMTEFTGAQDVTIYSLKGETFEIGNQATGTRPLIRIKDSRRFRLFGAGGICGVAEGSAPHIYRIENSSDLLFANVAHQIDFNYFADPQGWSAVSDGEIATPGGEFLVLYKRGAEPAGGTARRGDQQAGTTAKRGDRQAHATAKRGQKKLIEFGWDEPDPGFMRRHAAAMEKTPFDGCVFHVNYPKAGGKPGSFTWEAWGHGAFTRSQLQPALADLKAARLGRFRENFLRFNTTPADIDWFDDYSPVLRNASLAAWFAREARLPGILFDVEQYKGKLFEYSSQRDAGARSWEQYAAQARRRGREVMRAFQAEYPRIKVFLTLGYSYPWRQMKRTGRPLAGVSYGLLAPFLDGMVEAARGQAQIIDGHENAYGYRKPEEFPEAYRMMKEGVLPIVADPRRYARAFSFSFGIWMDADWRKAGWHTDDYSRNVHSPAALEAIVRAALRAADEYVWIYSETPRWWSDPDGDPVKLPAPYEQALRRARAVTGGH